jgi:hypothetical protein
MHNLHGAPFEFGIGMLLRFIITQNGGREGGPGPDAGCNAVSKHEWLSAKDHHIEGSQKQD